MSEQKMREFLAAKPEFESDSDNDPPDEVFDRNDICRRDVEENVQSIFF
jgi:hypothetical protein